MGHPLHLIVFKMTTQNTWTQKTLDVKLVSGQRYWPPPPLLKISPTSQQKSANQNNFKHLFLIKTEKINLKVFLKVQPPQKISIFLKFNQFGQN